MKLTVDEMIKEFQRIAAMFDIGDITSEPRQDWIQLKKDDIIDLMIDAYHLGHKHGKRTAVQLVLTNNKDPEND